MDILVPRNLKRFRYFLDAQKSENEISIQKQHQCACDVSMVFMRTRRARGAGAVFRTRFRTSLHARDAPRTLKSKFGEIENFRFRNLGSEILPSDVTTRFGSEHAHERDLEIFTQSGDPPH